MKGIGNLLAGWDGINNGIELPLGTYFYILDLGKESTVIHGDVSILK